MSKYYCTPSSVYHCQLQQHSLPRRASTTVTLSALQRRGGSSEWAGSYRGQHRGAEQRKARINHEQLCRQTDLTTRTQRRSMSTQWTNNHQQHIAHSTNTFILTRDIDMISTCLSVCPSVRPSVHVTVHMTACITCTPTRMAIILIFERNC